MNRLVIIGNGFDLAHGLKTGYNDFIADYLTNFMRQVITTNGLYDDILIREMPGKKSEIEILYYTCNNFTDSNRKIRFILETFKLQKLVGYNGYFAPLIFENENVINWVDIELCYYKVLMWFTSLNSGSELNKGNPNLILDLNQQFEFIKIKLIEYLDKINKDVIFEDSIMQKIIEKTNNYNLDKILILNFNYTHTAKNYQKNNYKIELINIHGSLGNKENYPIFGWGDDTNDTYRNIENLFNSNYFKFIKSFEYLRNDNHNKLFAFLDKSEFQVQIMGHSCGVSDRTMLNAIFEHENCIQIKPFYYEWGKDEDDYTQKTMEISRHFKNKHKMRRIIVDKENTKSLI